MDFRISQFGNNNRSRGCISVLNAADVLEDAGVDLCADLLVLEVLAFEDPVEVVQLVLDLLQLEVVDRRDLHLADDLEARLSLADTELDVQHVVAGRNARKNDRAQPNY